MNDSLLNVIQGRKTYAIIPARSGSKGVKNKNIKKVHGYPILAYSVIAAKLSNIDRIIVSTDSEEYADIARKYGAEVPFLRPEQFASDTSPDIDFMEHAIQWLYDNEKLLPEFWAHIRPTNPLRDPETINTAINTFACSQEATSLRSAHRASNTPFKWFKKTPDLKYFASIIDTLSLDEANNPRQNFPDVFIPDGYIDILRTSFIIKNDKMHGNKMLPFVVQENIDIDAQKDLDYLSYIADHIDNPVLNYLKNNYSGEN